jgi:hypothetical protein
MKEVIDESFERIFGKPMKIAKPNEDKKVNS